MSVLRIKLLVIFSFFMVNALCSTAYSEDRNLRLKVDRLERMLEQQMKSSLHMRLNQLQKENQQLRSLIEEQTYQVKKVNKRFHSLFEDLDERLASIEKKETSNRVNNKNKEETQSTQLNSELNQQTNQKSPEPVNFAKKSDNTIQRIDNQDIKTIDESVLKTVQKQSPDVSSDINEEENKLNIQKAYKKAFNELRASKYAKAERSFTQFLQKYPRSSYSDIAQYWLAETNYIQRSFNKAISNYQKIKSNSTKYKESILKIAYCYHELKNRKKAKEIANKLIKQYPKSNEAKQAKYLLKQMK